MAVEYRVNKSTTSFLLLHRIYGRRQRKGGSILYISLFAVFAHMSPILLFAGSIPETDRNF